MNHLRLGKEWKVCLPLARSGEVYDDNAFVNHISQRPLNDYAAGLALIKSIDFLQKKNHDFFIVWFFFLFSHLYYIIYFIYYSIFLISYISVYKYRSCFVFYSKQLHIHDVCNLGIKIIIKSFSTNKKYLKAISYMENEFHIRN